MMDISNKLDKYLNAFHEIQGLTNSGWINGSETHGTCAIATLQPVRELLDCSINATNFDALSSTVYSSNFSSSYGYELQGSHHTGNGDLSSEKVYCLRNIRERLKCPGCLKDFIEAYRCSRKSAVKARCRKFCLRRWTSNELQHLDCKELGTEIRIWTQTASICYNTIFPQEKQYIEQIFGGTRAAAHDFFFMAIVEHVAVELNKFAEAVSSTASFQKLFDVLDLYKALIAILPNINNIFGSISCSNICRRAAMNISSLATAIRKLLSSFEDTVLNELSENLPPKGTIHSATEYGINYVNSILQYKELLTDIIVSPPAKGLGNQEYELYLEASGRTLLGLHIIWIITSLRMNLKFKSSLYRDSASRCGFVMNNVDYILRSILGSPELQEMIGKEYLSMLSKDVAQAAQDYSSSIWDRVLYCLRDNGLKYKFPFREGISKNSVKKRFKAFNSTFKEVCETRMWMFVPDIVLHHQLHRLILSKLIPAYESFLENYGSLIQSGRNKERYIKYSSEDLADELKFCFQSAADYQVSSSTGWI